MTTSDSVEFDQFRLNAAKRFAQSMIFVDDEASHFVDDEESWTPDHKTVQRLTRPTEGINATVNLEEQSGEHITEDQSNKFKFNAKLLIDNAMNLGLICSVLRPDKDEDDEDVANRVVSAARVADIVCLDWEIYEDSGRTALKIISNILLDDNKRNGRLRLIAIYTADFTNKDVIMGKIMKSIPEEIRHKMTIGDKSLEIISDYGIRIVCLFKKNGIKVESSLVRQVSEDQLPVHLQMEFAKLSEGLLSNTALATVASLRDSTHHVLSRFVGAMDGPYFHHRASIENPEDAEEYAVNIVLSKLKGSVNKRELGAEHAGPEAISARIRELATTLGHNKDLILHYEKQNQKGKPVPGTYKLNMEIASKMVSNGLNSFFEGGKTGLTYPPYKADYKKSLCSMFADSLDSARRWMNQFAALTGIQAHPESFICQSGTWVPKLGLGTVILKVCKEEDKKLEEEDLYFLCLQASCDSVRIKGKRNFLFVRMEIANKGKPDHVVPVLHKDETEINYIGMNISSESYRSICMIEFSSCDNSTVNAQQKGSTRDFYFEDTEENQYRWIADLKQRRALRTARELGSKIGRLGFNEFEPFRN